MTDQRYTALSTPPAGIAPEHVRVCPACGTRYGANARFCPADRHALVDEAPNTTDDLVSTFVADRYYVERKLGEGGMGRVYLASQLPMNRPCALKVMREDALGIPDARTRFTREALNVSRLSHPNIVAVYDSGETAGGLPYIAMEFVEGEPLSQTLAREGRLEPVRAAGIILQTAAALQAAHTGGIIHRDLKPENILLGRTPSGDDHVKVVDFGIARAVQEESQQLTSTGVVLGTPAYMSPEQLTGDRVDARSDIFALALVGCVLLTGKLPFPAAQPELSARLVRPPTPLAELDPLVEWPAQVQEQLNRALAANPSDRPVSIRAFARDLVEALSAWQPESFAGLPLIMSALGPEVSTTLPPGLLQRVRTPTPAAAVRAVPPPPPRHRLLPVLVVVGATVGIGAWLILSNPVAPASVGTADSVAQDTVSGAKVVPPPATVAHAERTVDKRGKDVRPAAPDTSTSRPGLPDSGTAVPVTEVRTDSQPKADTAPPPIVIPDPAPVVPPRTDGWILIGNRTGAMLYIDGELRGTVPSLRTYRFTAGRTVNLTMRSEGCRDWDTTITVRTDTVRVGFKQPRC